MNSFVLISLSIIGFLIILGIVFLDEIKATKERDPAAKGFLQILLLYPGVHAIIFHRINHFLWTLKIPFFPRAFSQLARFLTGIEIHPGARIGQRLFIDHGMGVVIGETTIIGNNVTLFQGVTLGGTGKETGKRHPTLCDNVVIGAGAKVLGNIEIGKNSYVGANAVVIKSIPANATVVGVPGRITRKDGQRVEAELDHVHVVDPVMQHLKELVKRVKKLEEKESNSH
ncbi:MAG: serine O-acetyltransferase [Candidatus Omnitrophica bacterium]|nr:serine O-acetyltransferase [Candidatus Omnitrophota bacterium]MCB9747579.1 serine O-acetyltransferase [Candidatus Omnitrophota bacterium]